MGLIAVNPVYDRESSQDADFNTFYKLTFEAEFDSALDGPLAARTALGVTIGTPYLFGNASKEADANAFVTSIAARCISTDGKQWQIVYSYGPWNKLMQVQNPLDAPVDVQWGTIKYEEIVDQDVNGVAIVNAAGDPFDPPVTRDQSRPTLAMVRNEASYSEPLASTYRDCVNSTIWCGFAPGQVKVADITAERVWSQFLGSYFWRVTYLFEFNRFGWQKTILNQGLRQLVSGARQTILIDGQPASSPVPLTSAGAPLAPNATANFITFDVYTQIDFSVFNLAWPGP